MFFDKNLENSKPLSINIFAPKNNTLLRSPFSRFGTAKIRTLPNNPNQTPENFSHMPQLTDYAGEKFCWKLPAENY
jgi:hypothetical protein